MRIRCKAIMAFTLSEVLITLGIIGVVSTLTLPNLTNNYRKNVAITKLEKGYAQLAQAYEQMLDSVGDAATGQYQIAEEGQDENDNAKAYFNHYWRGFLKAPIYCASYSDCGYASNTPFSNIKGNAMDLKVYDKQKKATFMTNEGIVYMVNFAKAGSDTNTTDASNIVLMDITGGKTPNVIGKDVFVFVRTEDDGLMPYNYTTEDSKSDIYNECIGQKEGSEEGVTVGDGYMCAEFFRRNGWEVPNNYKF